MAIKILQCVYSMDRGGVEVWLMHLLRGIDRARFPMDFVVFSGQPGDFGPEVESLGSRFFPCAGPARPWRHAREFRSILQRYGPYDVVHSHDPGWNGTVLAIAKEQRVPIRIAHSHIDICRSLPGGALKRYYTKWSIRKSKKCATHGLACSHLAAASYFGKDWESDHRWRIFYYGEDFAPFREDVDADAIRESLGLPQGACVIGHVGSFRDHQKNHFFLLDVAREVCRLSSNTCFLLVGEGALRRAVEKEVRRAGLGGRIRFAGVRSDVPRLMLGAMDAFLFPSLYEGLGLVLVEAQTAGLPCVCSDVIPEEADIVPGLVTRISLDQKPGHWARTLLDMVEGSRRPCRRETLRAVEESRFNLSMSIQELEVIYSCIAPNELLP